jgi:hypothetical protein
VRRRWHQVNDAALYVGTAIVDAHDYRFARPLVGDANVRSQGEALRCCCHCTRIRRLTISGSLLLSSSTIDRRDAGLRMCHGHYCCNADKRKERSRSVQTCKFYHEVISPFCCRRGAT